MKKRFIVSMENPLPEQTKAFYQFISKQMAWWHYWDSLWLLVDTVGHWTCITLRDKVTEMFPDQMCVIIEITEDHDTWAGFGPQSPDNFESWLNKYWTKG